MPASNITKDGESFAPTPVYLLFVCAHEMQMSVALPRCQQLLLATIHCH